MGDILFQDLANHFQSSPEVSWILLKWMQEQKIDEVSVFFHWENGEYSIGMASCAHDFPTTAPVEFPFFAIIEKFSKDLLDEIINKENRLEGKVGMLILYRKGDTWDTDRTGIFFM